MFGISFPYDDAWIMERWERVHNWSVLCRQYNEEHGTDYGYSTFKAHCNRELGLSFKYTQEHDDWLIENYPLLGRNKAAEEFNRRFGTHKTPQAIKVRCVKLGLRVTEQRRKDRAKENTKRCHQPGTVKVMGNHGLCVKTADGSWQKIADTVIGKAPNGFRNVHLDGDVTNNSPENLARLSFGHCALMTRYDFWSDEPQVTKTGIVWCDLHDALRESINEAKGVDDEGWTNRC